MLVDRRVRQHSTWALWWSFVCGWEHVFVCASTRNCGVYMGMCLTVWGFAAYVRHYVDILEPLTFTNLRSYTPQQWYELSRFLYSSLSCAYEAIQLVLCLCCVFSVPTCINVSSPPHRLLIYESHPGLSLLPAEGSIDGTICRDHQEENRLMSTNIMNILLTTTGLQQLRFRWSKKIYYDTRYSGLFHFEDGYIFMVQALLQKQCLIWHIYVAVIYLHAFEIHTTCCQADVTLFSSCKDKPWGKCSVCLSMVSPHTFTKHYFLPLTTTHFVSQKSTYSFYRVSFCVLSIDFSNNTKLSLAHFISIYFYMRAFVSIYVYTSD